MKTKTTDKYFCDNVQSYKDEILKAKCIFIHGVDAFQRDRCYKFIMETLVPIITPTSRNERGGALLNDGINTFLFYGDEYATPDKVVSILNTLNTISFDMSDRIVSIRYFDEIKPEAADKIAKYTENPNPDTKLIIVSDKIDARRVVYKTIIKNSLHIETTEMKYPKDLKFWLNKYLKDNKINMDSNAIDFFSEIVELEAHTAYNEIQKLQLFVGKKNFISVDDVRACTVNSRKYSVFELQEAIGLRNKSKALIIAENLIENDENIIMIIASLTSFFFNLWKWNALKNKGATNYDIKAKYMGTLHDFIKEKNINYLNNFNQKQVDNALKHLYICDCRKKLSYAEDDVLAAALVMGILGGGRG